MPGIFTTPGLFDDDDDEDDGFLLDHDPDARPLVLSSPPSAGVPALSPTLPASSPSSNASSKSSKIWLFSDPFHLFPVEQRSSTPDPAAVASTGAAGDPNELNRHLETIPGLSKVLNGYHTYMAEVSVRQLSVELLTPVFSTEKSFLTSFGDLYMGSRPADHREPTSPRSAAGSGSGSGSSGGSGGSSGSSGGGGGGSLSASSNSNIASLSSAEDLERSGGGSLSFVGSFIARRRTPQHQHSVSSGNISGHISGALASSNSGSGSGGGSGSGASVSASALSSSLAMTVAQEHPQKWLLIFSDLLVVASLDQGVEHQIPLRTCWIESLESPEFADYARTGIVIRTPERVLSLYAPNTSKKSFCTSTLMRLIRQELETQDSYLGPDRRVIANYMFHSGHMYTGEWLSGVPHGTGTMLSLDGTKYDGQWANGKKQGHGFMLARSSQNYEGEFKDDLRDGWGKLTLPDENDYSLISYTGHWKRNLRHGLGTLVFTSLDSVQCEFVEDRPQNPVYWTGSSKIRYIGSWNFGQRIRQGFGVGVYPSGERYYGIWANDMREQIGVLISPTGTQYFGGWKKDKHFGKCRIRFPNGDILTAAASQGDWNDSLEVEKASFQIAETQRQYSRSRQPPPRIQSADQMGEKWLALFRAKLTRPKQPPSSSSSSSRHGTLDAEHDDGMECDHFSPYVTNLHAKLKEYSDKEMTTLLFDVLKEVCSSPDHPIGSTVRAFVHYFNTMYSTVFDLIAPLIQLTKFDSAVSDIQSFLVRFPSEFAFNYLMLPALDPQQLTMATHAALFPHIAALLMPSFIEKFSTADQLFSLKSASVRKLPPDEMFAVIGIEGQVASCILGEFKRLKSDPSLPSDLYPFLNAIDTLSDFGEFTTSHDKLGILEATARHIEEYLKGFIGAFGADEFLPVFTFVLIQADIPNLHAHTNFIETFMDSDLKCAMSGYLFTQLQVAIGFVMSDQFKLNSS